MKDTSRVFGSNLRYYLKQKGMQLGQIADKLGYSEYEIQKIMDARLFLDGHEKEQIAKALDMSVERLYVALEDEVYESAGCLECRGKFSTAEHKKEVLDLFDVYCDIQETLTEEGLKPSN
ncbi:MAG: helix-turn-helix domain-containing protein [Lachnospiraceae bacterium]|nr:helix-turn-helix domain-containing protein [Lachnospiraceae bacterium]